MIALDHAVPLRAVSKAIAPCDVLFVTEASPWGKIGYDVVEAALPSVTPVFWSPGMPKPDLSGWRGNWILSFKADLILSRSTLERAKKGAINFHPSPPKYRGLGGYWWALRNGDQSFGVTAHHMDEQIDHGEIIKTDSFGILPRETVESLKERAAIHSLRLLRETVEDIQNGKPFEPSGAKWEPHLYTSKDLLQAQTAQEATTRRTLGTLVAIHDGIADLSEAPRPDRTSRLALG